MVLPMSMLADARRVIGAAAGRALDLALPAACAGCGQEGDALCRECRPALDVRLDAAPGVPVGLPADIPPPLVQLEWCAPFTGVTRRALHALKYDGERRLAPWLGASVARRWAKAGVGAELIVPVPASPDRVRDRGYDQAALIAGVAARHLRLPVAGVLVRTRATTAQFDLDRAARATNLVGAVDLASPQATRAVQGRWIVLVDDVMTTGATLATCAVTLLEAGAIAVSAVTVARER